eukprot:CAMPEP_0197418400 /NCGR_PEP_ID=MMETSP1170-20131217/4130_1 /TAXON_ID=54406 /ORGANISM="Sarcinochrysis sp, Strain CCMP770" /LENGTH=42 /DNA_ID= /DNA_START= /DNA_END= /DNA_ORIENTATION=
MGPGSTEGARQKAWYMAQIKLEYMNGGGASWMTAPCAGVRGG